MGRSQVSIAEGHDEGIVAQELLDSGYVALDHGVGLMIIVQRMIMESHG